MTDSTDLSAILARNIRELRASRSMTQQQMAKLAELPRATWANLETGTANPTLAVLHRTARALGVSIEELLAPPRAACRHYPKSELKEKKRGRVVVRKLLPDPVPGMDIERMELPSGSRMTGTPHTAGTREYLTCERGAIELVAAGERWVLQEGDVVAFRGDQRHSYKNVGKGTAVGYSVIMLVSPHAVA